MKKLIPLLLGLASLASIAIAADEPSAPVLDLTKPPTFGELTKAGLKFSIPRWLAESWDDTGIWRHRKNNRGFVDMAASSARFALKKAEARSEPFDWEGLSCDFPVSELADPGDHYPPVLPLTENSKLSRMRISGKGKDVPAICAQAAALLKVLGVSDPKLETWISSEMWKNAPQYQAEYPDLTPKLHFSIVVSKPFKPDPAGGNRPQLGQPVQPQEPQESQDNPPQVLERNVTFSIGLSEWQPAP